MERIRRTFDIKIHRYDQLSEDSKAIVDLIWPDGDYPRGSSLHKSAKGHGLSIDEYLLQRFNSPNPGTKKCGGRKLSEEDKQYLSNYWKGKKKSEQHTARIREAKEGDKNPMYGTIKLTREKTLSIRKLRTLPDHRLWRKRVLERDNSTCQKTGRTDGILHVHHIWPFAAHEYLRFSTFNGITLCKDAHDEFHRKYGLKRCSVFDLEEFLGKELPPSIRKEAEVQVGWEMYEYCQGLSDYDEHGNYYWDD